MRADSPQDRFTTLFERHRRIVLKVANLYGWQAEDRRDLAQEISVQLWRSFPSYDERRSFSTWMYRIALNVAISFVRRARLRAKYSVSLDEGVVDPIDSSATASAADPRVRALYRFIGGSTR